MPQGLGCLCSASELDRISAMSRSASGRHSRMVRERKTVEAMIHLYCNELHQDSDGLCNECTQLIEYALERLDGCPFQAF
jgi:hypothetical protein